MSVTTLEASGKGRTDREYSRLKRIILVCVFVAAGITGGDASPAVAQEPAGPDDTTGSTQATDPQEVQYLCASRFGGQMRYVTSPSQCRAFLEDSLELSADDPIYACASGTGSVRRVADPSRCLFGETSLTLPGEEAVYFCAANNGGRLRYITDPGQCRSTETAVVVPPANNAPVADDQSVSTDEDVAVDITLTATDEDGDTLTYAIADDPANGTLSGTAPNVTYTPNDDFNGTDSFTFEADDGNGGTDTATVTITVAPVNDAPAAEDQSVSTDEEVEVDITLTASDEDGDTLTYTIVDEPANGTLSGTGDDRTYTPDSDYSGPDSFTFKVNDGTADSNTATVSITVNPVNDDPTISDIADQSTNEDTATGDVAFIVGDEETAAADLDVTGSSDNTTLVPNANIEFGGTGENRTVKVTPADNESGTATITVTVTDADGGTSSDTFELTVTAVDDAPTAVGDAATVDEDSAATAIDVLDNDTDPDGGTKTISSNSDPTNGTVVLTGGSSGARTGLTYEPDPDYCNTPPGTTLDTFTYTLNEGSTATVSVTVNCVNDEPSFTAGPDQDNVPNQDDNGQPAAYAVDPWATGISAGPNESDQTLTFEVTNDNNSLFDEQPAVSSSGVLTFTPNPEQVGTATVTVELQDDGGTANGGDDTSPSQTFTITTVFPPPDAVNDPEAADADQYAANGGIPIDIPDSIGVLKNDVLRGGEIDGYGASTGTEETTLGEATATAQGGFVTLNADGSFRYEAPPSPPSGGTDTFLYQLTNDGGSDVATVTITVSGQAFFVDDSAGTGGNGSLLRPFDSPSDVPGSRANDGLLYLFSGTYSGGGVTLKSGEDLVGQGVALSDNLPFTLAPRSATSELPGTGTSPSVGASTANANAVTLGSNNTVKGLNVGNTNGGSAISGASIGNLSVGTVGINTNGQALNLSEGTLSGSGFTQLRSTDGTNNVSLSNVGTSGTPALGTSSDALSGANQDAFKIDGGSGSLSYPGTISNATGRHVSVANRGSGTVTFGGAISGSGTGVSLDNNDNATLNFTGGLTLSTGTSGAFTATNGGTVNVTGSSNTLVTGSGAALKVQDTNIGSSGLTFRSISANGATNGIVLNNTGSSGGLTVSGNGGSCTIATPTCTGGTIQNTTGDGVSLTNTSNPSFGYMQVKDTAGHGISGTTTSGLNLSNSLVRGAGDADNEAGLYFATTNGTNLTGNSSITNTVVHAPADVGAFIQNYGGTLNLTVSGSTFSGTQKNTPGVVTGDDLLRMIADRTSSGSATITAKITGSTFKDSESDDILANAQSSTGSGGGTMNLTVDGNTFDGNGVFETCETTGCNSYAIVTQGTQGSTIRYTIQNNNIINHLDAGVAARSDNNSNVQGVIQNNTIGAAGSPRSGSYRDRGIFLASDDDSDFIARVENNTIHSTFFEGISASTTDGTGLSPKMDLTILGNRTPTPADTGGTYLPSIGMTASGKASACARTENNTAQTGHSSAGSIDFLLFRDTAASTATFKLEGLSSPTADASSFVKSKNLASADPVYAFAAKDSSNSSTPQFTGGTCRTPASTPTP